MRKSQYIIIAGVNGAGKSTLYSVNPDLFLKTRRINADEYLKSSGGDWRNPKDNAQAMKRVVKELHQAFSNQESIHQETTLAGTGKPFENLVKKAQANHYKVTLLYIYLESPELAIERVKSRVNKGGHGVDEKIIRKRYDSSLTNLLRLHSIVDEIKIYDNTKNFQLLYHRDEQNVIYSTPFAEKILEDSLND